MTCISVVVPAYNASAFLSECIHSIHMQSEEALEVLVVDDGSTDDTKKIAESLNCRVISHEKNRGIGAARKTGAEEAKEDFVAFLSADDTYHPLFLELMARQIQTETDLLFCNYWRCDAGLIPQSVFIAPEYSTFNEFRRLCIEWALRQNMFVNFSTVLISKLVFDSVQFHKDLRFGEDLVFLLETLRAGFTWSGVSLPLLYYRVHEQAGTFKGWNAQNRAILWRHLRPLLRDLGVARTAVDDAVERANRLCVRKKRKQLIPSPVKSLYRKLRQFC